MKKILIIEDDLIYQMAITRMLKKQNIEYQYTIAKSIKAAKMELTQTSFDFVITDHNLADGTTFDLLDDLKNTSFILISGNEVSSTINSVKSKLGAIACYTKDLDMNYLEELPKVIKQFFKQKIVIPKQQKNQSILENVEVKHKEFIPTQNTQNVFISLKNAHKIFDGKKQEIKESIELFIFHKPREMENLYNYLNKEDCQNVQKTTHLMKSGFRIFEMKAQFELAEFIEKSAGLNEKMCSCEKVINAFKQLSIDTKIAIEKLQKEIPLL